MRKITALILTFLLICNQTGLAQVAATVPAGLLGGAGAVAAMERFRPLHLRYFSYDAVSEKFTMLLDKGDNREEAESGIKEEAGQLLKFFLIGISLPDSKFWVNLRPDSEDQIIDGALESTDIGRILLEADVQLKKDTSSFTSPRCPEGRAYWDKLYQRAEELYAGQDFSIPALARPWIVPDEIIVREDGNSAYIYKATLKVMLEDDYLKGSSEYNFSDPRQKALNEYSSRIIREKIIPLLNKEVNTSKKYAALRQVYYSLILARWFKARFKGGAGAYPERIDRGDMTGLTSGKSWSKDAYFQQYKRSFTDGEYNIEEQINGPSGTSMRVYLSGGIGFEENVRPTGAFQVRGGLSGFAGRIADASSAIVIQGSALDAESSLAVVTGRDLDRENATGKEASSSPAKKTPDTKLSLALSDLQKKSPALSGGYSFGKADKFIVGTARFDTITIKQTNPKGKIVPVARLKFSKLTSGSIYTEFAIQHPAGALLDQKVSDEVEAAVLPVLKQILPPGQFIRYIGSENVTVEAFRESAVGKLYSAAGFSIPKIESISFGDKRYDSDYSVNRYMVFNKSSSPLDENEDDASDPVANDTGGIDFRVLPITFQATGSFSSLRLQLPVVKDAASVDISQELSAVRRMIERNMLPSGQRLKELLAVCIEKGSTEAQTTELLGCLTQICRFYEEEAAPTSQDLREALLIVDSEEFPQ